MPSSHPPTSSISFTQGNTRLPRVARVRNASISVDLAALLIISILLACSIGAVEVHPGVTLRIILKHLILRQWTILPPPSPVDGGIIWSTRLPRTLVGATCGTELAVIGLAAQLTLRNVLAGSYILGVSTGASTRVAAVMVLGLRMANSPVHVGIGVSAFIGSLVSLTLIMTLAREAGRLTNTRVIFAGMAVSFFLSALTNLIIMFAGGPTTTRSIVFWMLGPLAGSHWLEVAIAVGASDAGVLGLIAVDRRIDALPLDDNVARALGVDPQRQCFLVLLLISFVVVFLVALTGTVGFIGLVVPHLAKKLHSGIFRRPAPICTVIGTIIIVLAGLLTRIAATPNEMSTGVITSLLGAPLLMSLIGRDARNEEWQRQPPPSGPRISKSNADQPLSSTRSVLKPPTT